MEKKEHTPTEREKFIEFMKYRDLMDSSIEKYLIYYDLYSQFEITQEFVEEFLKLYNNKVARASLLMFLKFKKIKDLDIPPYIKKKRVRMIKRITDDEMDILRKALYETSKRNMGGKYFIMIELQLQGALRVAELTGIKPKDFEWDEWDEDMSKPCILNIYGKGDKQRKVSVHPKLAKSIYNYIIKNINSSRLEFDRRLFGMGTERWRTVLREISEKLIGRRIHPHEVRHTSATTLWDTGRLNILEMRDFLGHADISTTQIYLHVDKEKTLKKVGDYIMEQQSSMG